MQQQNNSGGGNGGNNTLLVVLLIGVAGIGGYLLYTAGKKTAANASGAAGINPATGLPYTTTAVRPATNYGSGPALNGGGNNTSGTIGAVGGLLNNIIGLFGKKKTTATNPYQGANTNPSYQGHTLGGGLNDQYYDDIYNSGMDNINNQGWSWPEAETSGGDVQLEGGWNNQGGWTESDGYGGVHYFDAYGIYEGSEDQSGEYYFTY